MLKAVQALSLFLAGVFIGAALSSFAGPQYEIGIGYSKGKTAPDGIWWEHQFDTHNRVESPSWSIGVSTKFSDSNWGVRWDFGQLLRFSTRNMAVSDEHTAPQVASGELKCNPSNGQNCLWRWNGDGEAVGMHIGFFREFDVRGFKLQPEVGILPYLYSWNMVIEHPYDSRPTEHATVVSGAGLYLTEYARLTVQRGMFFARLDYDYFVKGHNPIAGIQEGKVLSYMLGASVSF